MTGFLDKLDLSQLAPAIADPVLVIWRERRVSDRAKQLELDVWQATHMAPGVDTLPEEKIHRLAYENPRPPRLTRWDTYGEAD